MNINEIQNDGFYIRDTHPRVKNMAFLSLSMALKAYFETYKSMSFRFSHLKDTSVSPEDRDYYSASYIENASEAIFHLQHFLELFIKELLEKEHKLLAIDVKKKHTLLFDLIKGNTYDESLLENERHIEFSEALERIVLLIKENRIDREKYEFIVDSNTWLKSLNTLRNRIAHRGVFILRYQALDYLFGKHVFPFLKQLLTLEGNENRFSDLKLKSPNGEVLIIDEIIKHFESEAYNISKIALLKELGRACFENPTKYQFITGDTHERRRAELIAEEISKLEDIGEVLVCPVCQTKSLVKYHDYVETYDSNTNEYAGDVQIVYNVTCYCCSLELFSNLGVIKNMNLDLEDYFSEIP
ncbi:hypothetical protein J1N10_19940 [Carboxylicivirga sp. A043]|uniref:hypothetical protein n=1 Tax=Carboxylicivirga litoralis TaxID=2816963 RepID=UPI0021CB0C3C|nr:hypothetical protein [Carboxylicivirga sp. A043]MCU4158255.1 hypothetical protein [Carboxylicivirga sp. A043]